MSSNQAARAACHTFVVPSLEGPVTGGTLFNRCLIEALLALDEQVEWFPIESVTVRERHRGSFVWVDSLYLDYLPQLHHEFTPSSRVGLLVHYIPSLLAHGEGLSREQLTGREKTALEAADAFLVTSQFMRLTLKRLGITGKSIIVVEPGRVAPAPVSRQESIASVKAVAVANLVSNKGLLPLLRELHDKVTPEDCFHLDVIGSKSLEPDYALQCEKCLTRCEPLSERVRLRGALSPAEVVAQLQVSNLFVSASPMETYGMALAEARTVGLPVIAHRGGHVAALVDYEAGGELVDSPGQLARALLQLCRNPEELSARSSLARMHTLPLRSWATAARDLVDQLRVAMKDRANEIPTSTAPNAARRLRK